MPRVKIDYVVSFSSEDAESPASNLLASEVSNRRWLCGGAASCSVVVQLARAVRVSGVTVGAHHAALVEVLVGRSETPDDPYKVLVPSCVFLSPVESRKGEGVERVRSFSGDQLAADVRDSKWDRVRVVCSQPYNKHCKYGLSFIHIFEPEGQDNQSAATTALAPSVPSRLFTLDGKSSDEEDSFKPGELFAKHLQNKTGSTTSTEVQIRQASTQAIKQISESATKLVKTPISKEKTKASASSINNNSSNLRERDNLMYTDDDNKPHVKIDKVLQRHNDEKRKKEDESSNKMTKICDDEDKQQTHSNDNILNSDKNSRKQKHSDVDRNSSLNISSSSRTKDTTSRSKEKSDDNRANNQIDKKRTESCNKPHVSERDRDRDASADRLSKKRRNSDDDSNSSGKKSRLAAGPVSRSPHELLAGVVFVLSGYQNPRRAKLRDLALALGATYSRDWAPHCTHLICAFPKTPKLQAVRSGAQGESAVVVRGEWLEETSARRRPLPWQWFATEPQRRVPRPRGDGEEERGAAGTSHSECDTDDEIEKVLQKQKKDREKNGESRLPKNEARRSSADARDTDTSRGSDVTFVRDERVRGHVTLSDSGDSTEEEEAGEERGDGGGDTLPDFLEGRTFLIEPGVRDAGFDTDLLARYVRAYGGELLEQSSQLDADSEVSYVLCGPRGSAVRGAGAVLRADWLWRCHQKRRLCSTDKFLVT